jgi:membrane protease YdiL (CAAX protease family)
MGRDGQGDPPADPEALRQHRRDAWTMSVRRVRLPRVLLYLILTFALSWGFDAAVAGAAGYQAYLATGMTPWGMFVPAAVALVLRMFIFPDSPLHYRRYQEKPRWLLLAYLVLTLAYGVVTVLAVSRPDHGRLLSGVGSLLITLWTLLAIFLAGQTGPQAFRRAGLGLGDVARGQRIALGAAGFLLLGAVLNLLFGLGAFQGRPDRVYGVGVPAGLYPIALVVLFLAVALIGLPLSGLAAVFGEEYGWRGFLQDELGRAGRLPGALLVGLVWGLWHLPVILRGVHTYPPSALGLVLGLLFFLLWGLVQSYAVLKTGGIWAAAFTHGVVNSVYSFTLTYGVRPADNLWSFGLGVYGLACLTVIVALLLRDPVWREEG